MKTIGASKLPANGSRFIDEVSVGCDRGLVQKPLVF